MVRPTSTPTARKVEAHTVRRALARDESNGYAVAMFRIERGQQAWQPDPVLPPLTGPGTVVYERQFGRISGSMA